MTDPHDAGPTPAAFREAGLDRAIAANLPNGAAFVVDHNLRYLLADGPVLREAGYTPAQVEGRTIAEVMPAELARQYESRYRQALAGRPFRHEHEARGRHYVTHGAPLRDAAGAVVAALAVSYDLTDRVAAERALRASEGRFRLLVAAVRDYAIFSLDPDGRVASWNSGAERLLGYRADEALGGAGELFFIPEDRAKGLFPRELATAKEAGRAGDENWLLRKDGTRFWASGATTALTDDAGRLQGFVKIFRDLTEQRAADEAVRDSRERLRLALSAARMGIWRWEVGADRHARDANLNRLFGRPPDETTQPFADFLAIVHPDDRAAVRAAFAAAVGGGRHLNVEFRVVWPDGTVRWIRDQGDLLPGTAGGAAVLTGACVDVTDRRQAEEALRQARDELEVRVAARTAELATALDDLRTEAAERRQAQEARQELLARLVTAQEEARQRIARDLHDHLGQYLAAMRLGLTTLRAAAGGDATNTLDQLAALTDDVGREAHRLALELRPTSLDDIGLRAAVANYVEAWATRAGVPAEFDSRGLDGERFPWPVSTAIYRVVQEALTNVLKHAGATRVSVFLERRAGQLSVIVEDDGRGFDPDAAAADRLGLVGMRERAGLVGGTLEVDSSPAGTAVFVRVPLPEGGPPS